MNPDVEMEVDCLSVGIAYLERNRNVAMVSPRAVDAIGANNSSVNNILLYLTYSLEALCQAHLENGGRATFQI